MRCIVPTCKHDSRRISKSQGITFHIFPIEPSLRTAWLKALNREGWEPRERSAVCSDHFEAEDLYVTRSGLRKVRVGAVPLVMQSAPTCDLLITPDDVKACRVCLDTHGQLYPMTGKNLSQAYETLTGIKVASEHHLPCYLCFECAHRLLRCVHFRTKSLRAHVLLLDIAKKEGITLKTIKSINRVQNNLNSSLVLTHNSPDHYDITLLHEDKETVYEEPPGLHEVTLMEAVKTEREEYEEVNEHGLKHEDVFKQENRVNDDEVSVYEETFVGKDYSSDDSLPLGRRQKSKRKGSKLKKVPKSAEPKVDRRRKPFLNNDLNETLFTIADLSVEEQLAEIEKRRETANYKNSSFKCTVCYKGFLDADAFSGHMMRHSNECGEHECEICKTHFKHPHALRKHVTAHHTQRFSCNQCAYVTTHRQTARLHERWHKGTKYKCPHCPEEFLKFTTYMGHVRIKHPSDFVCELCGYSFVSEKGIELHKKLKHRLEAAQIPEDGPFCELCNVRFVSQEAHKRHLSVSAKHNTGDKQKEPRQAKLRKCPARRGARCPSADSGKGCAPLLPGPIPCEQCGLQLEDSRAYHGHFRRMHPDKNRTNYPSMKSPCMCEVCGRMFQSYALLKDHRWTHTGERPFACDACGKRFRMRQRLTAHRRVHREPRGAYACALCGKHFSTHSNRQRHMFIHTGLKPFVCEMCGKSFKHASEKRAHVTYVHLKKPWPKRARGKRRERAPPGQPEGAAGGGADASETDIPPAWPCESKMADMGAMLAEKPLYYNLKI